MADRYEIRLSGFGGQGLIFAGIILAEAIGIHEGKYVTQSQSYGPEARGGKSRSEIVFSDEPIDYPRAINVDLLLAMSQDACDTYFIDLKPSGLLIVDATFVKESPLSRAISIPCTEISQSLTGTATASNMVALGAICRCSGVVSPMSLKKAILNRSPKGTEGINIKAFNAGIKAAGTCCG
ncbi:MAG: 2-oxoacid:acceptor oxidoreductase family protein [Desulfobacterales bacterium]|nr:2-oxoacid:acceptor oxidoreductase family protein [Desulfobacterales bacterium]MDD4072305.1 2-oxoacid:acceptor oxidoreductase family protein [Desulfobacterales bacterium]MDD4391312.1 2-oxoacid:acceptor oxidoreductase family protein [Desulfobacterales bacterium]